MHASWYLRLLLLCPSGGALAILVPSVRKRRRAPSINLLAHHHTAPALPAADVLNGKILSFPRPAPAADWLSAETNVRIPRRAVDGPPMNFEERVRLLELKVNSWFNWGKDPFIGSKGGNNKNEVPSECKNLTKFLEYR